MNAFPATDPDTEARRTVSSELLGEIRVPEESVFHFPQGLYGFEDARSFVLIPAGREGLFWLQSADFSALAFLLVDPFRWVDNYNVDLPDAELVSLAPADAGDVAVLAIVTLPRNSEERPTANLQGPVTLNVRKRVGRQIVIQDSVYDTRHELDLFPDATGEESAAN